MFRIGLVAACLAVLCSGDGRAALLSVTLEPSPHIVTGAKFAVLDSSATSPENAEYAPLLNPAISAYSFTNVPTMFVDAYNPAEGVRGAGASRIYGKLRQDGSTTYIDTTVYSYIEQAFATDTNIVLGRLKIQLNGQNYTWKTQIPASEFGHAFSGVMRSDADGAIAAPELLLANQAYYFHFVYQVSGAASIPGGAGSPFSRTSRHFNVILNSTSPVPEPVSLATWGVFMIGFGAWNRVRATRAQRS